MAFSVQNGFCFGFSGLLIAISINMPENYFTLSKYKTWKRLYGEMEVTISCHRRVVEKFFVPQP